MLLISSFHITSSNNCESISQERWNMSVEKCKANDELHLLEVFLLPCGVSMRDCVQIVWTMIV